MLELIVAHILVAFIILAILNYIKASFWLLLVNIILAVFVMIFIGQDLKKKYMHNYYLISLVVVSVMFILSGTWLLGWFFYLLDLGGINIFLQALILMFVIPNLIRAAYVYYKTKIKKEPLHEHDDEHSHEH